MQIPPPRRGRFRSCGTAISAFSDVKPSLAWAETYPGTLSYYLASAFREVWMQPSGTVGLVGFATNALFLRDALDKAGIEAQFIARGEYKSAANLFTQDRYTDAHREADSRLHREPARPGVAGGRRVASPRPVGASTRSPTRRRCCATTRWPAGLVDRIGFRDEAYAPDRRTRPARQDISAGSGDDDPDAPPRLYLSRYARASAARAARRRCPAASPSRRSPSSPWPGPIVSGRGGPQLLAARHLERGR